MKTFSAYIREQYNIRATSDRRKRVDMYIVEYLDDEGNAYRRRYEFPPKTPFDAVRSDIPRTI